MNEKYFSLAGHGKTWTFTDGGGPITNAEKIFTVPVVDAHDTQEMARKKKRVHMEIREGVARGVLKYRSEADYKAYMKENQGGKVTKQTARAGK